MKRPLFLLPLLLPGVMSAQNFEYAASLEQVSFSSAHMFEMRYDDNDSFIPMVDQWTLDGDAHSMAIRSGSFISASARVRFDCMNTTPAIWLRGSGDDGLDFPAQLCYPDADDPWVFLYPSAVSDEPLTDTTIRFFESFETHWEISLDSLSWAPVDGYSANRLYVTLNDPVSENDWADYFWFESLFYISCKNADGANTWEEMIPLVWEDFTDREVMNVDGDIYSYYGPGVMCTSFETFFETTNGWCTLFAQFFASLLKIQGYDQTYNMVSIYADPVYYCDNNLSLFFVKNWDFHDPSGPCDALPYLRIDWYGSYHSEIDDLEGVAGQGYINPTSLFGGHSICYIDGVFYDPSYGYSYATMEELEEASIEGYGSQQLMSEQMVDIDLDGDGVLEDAVIYQTIQGTNDIEKGDLNHYFYTF